MRGSEGELRHGEVDGLLSAPVVSRHNRFNQFRMSNPKRRDNRCVARDKAKSKDWFERRERNR